MATVQLQRDMAGRILDLGGGGEGVIGRLYGEQVLAIDIRQDELDEAPPGPEKRRMDACALCLPDTSFDYVTAFYFFMYLPKQDHATAIREAYRVLRPGGHLRIWDAVIERDGLFIVDLDIDLAGDMLHTGYGVGKPDPAQDIDHFLLLAASAGFMPGDSSLVDGQIYLCFKKPLPGARRESDAV